jgi:hypothetical protein
MIPYAVPADTASHRNLPIYTYGGASQIVKLLKTTPSFKADIGVGTGWVAYSGMDQVFRLLAGKKPINNELASANRLFDAQNADQVSEPGGGFGESYVAGYDKLWLK